MTKERLEASAAGFETLFIILLITDVILIHTMLLSFALGKLIFLETVNTRHRNRMRKL